VTIIYVSRISLNLTAPRFHRDFRNDGSVFAHNWQAAASGKI
jgi:hypothetical protein